jgi:hypothetical protein
MILRPCNESEGILFLYLKNPYATPDIGLVDRKITLIVTSLEGVRKQRFIAVEVLVLLCVICLKLLAICGETGGVYLIEWKTHT